MIVLHSQDRRVELAYLEIILMLFGVRMPGLAVVAPVI